MFSFYIHLQGCRIRKGKDGTHLFTCWIQKSLDCSFAYSIHQDNIMFIQNALLFGFAFSCIGAGLPKTEANWQHVISDLKRIEDLFQVSTHFSIKYLV